MESEIKTEIKTSNIQIIFASALATVFGYVFNNIKIPDIVEIYSLLTKGLPLLKSEILTSNFYTELPFVPIVSVWFLIGALAYLNYYSLNVLYCNIYNYLVLHFNYTKPNVDDNYILRKNIRFMIHTLVIISYTFLYLLLLLLLLPIGEVFRTYVASSIHIFSQTAWNIAFSYFFLFLYWLISFGVLAIIFDKVKTKLKLDELEADHCQI